MKVGDMVRSVSRKNHFALVIGFKELWEGCGNKYPIIMWCDNQQVDSCSHRRLVVISDIHAKDSQGR
jgi:hypothetical protein